MTFRTKLETTHCASLQTPLLQLSCRGVNLHGETAIHLLVRGVSTFPHIVSADNRRRDPCWYTGSSCWQWGRGPTKSRRYNSWLKRRPGSRHQHRQLLRRRPIFTHAASVSGGQRVSVLQL